VKQRRGRQTGDLTINATIISSNEFRFLAFGDASGLEDVVCRWVNDALAADVDRWINEALVTSIKQLAW
jgi:hypothetical protein